MPTSVLRMFTFQAKTLPTRVKCICYRSKLILNFLCFLILACVQTITKL